MKNVCAVVVTYNRKALLQECIDAILKQTYAVEKVVILDNNSNDGTEDALKTAGYLDNERVVFEHLSENTGGAGGFHYGMKKASEFSPDWIWIMDDDVVPLENCLEELIKASEVVKEKVSFLASSVRGMKQEPMNVPKVLKESTKTYVDWNMVWFRFIKLHLCLC